MPNPFEIISDATELVRHEVPVAEKLLSDARVPIAEAVRAVQGYIGGIKPNSAMAGMMRAGLQTNDERVISGLHAFVDLQPDQLARRAEVLTGDDVLTLKGQLERFHSDPVVQQDALRTLGAVRDLLAPFRKDPVAELERASQRKAYQREGYRFWVDQYKSAR